MSLLQGSVEKKTEETRKEMQDLKRRGREEDIEISEEEFQAEIMNLKKAPGSDGLRNELWIWSTGTEVQQKLLDILKSIWAGSGFPGIWRKGIIKPIFKKGDREDLKNYRGVTLLNTSYKIYAGLKGDF